MDVWTAIMARKGANLKKFLIMVSILAYLLPLHIFYLRMGRGIHQRYKVQPGEVKNVILLLCNIWMGTNGSSYYV